MQLTENQLNNILASVNSVFPESKVYLFGSRAKGTARQFSDCDLAIQADEKLKLNHLAQLEEIFAESDLPFKIDLIDLQRVSEEFQQHILETGELLTS